MSEEKKSAHAVFTANDDEERQIRMAQREGDEFRANYFEKVMQYRLGALQWKRENLKDIYAKCNKYDKKAFDKLDRNGVSELFFVYYDLLGICQQPCLSLTPAMFGKRYKAISRQIATLFDEESWRSPIVKKYQKNRHELYLMLQTLGMAVECESDDRFYDKGTSRILFLVELGEHLWQRLYEKIVEGAREDNCTYTDGVGYHSIPGVYIIRLVPFETDQRVREWNEWWRRLSIYRELAEIHGKDRLVCIDWGLRVRKGRSKGTDAPHQDYDMPAFTNTLESSQIVSTYVNLMEAQTHSKCGMPDFYLCSHLPLPLQKKLLEAREECKEMEYQVLMNRVQILLNGMEAMHWWGSTMHAGHPCDVNQDQWLLYYVVLIEGIGPNDDSKDVRGSGEEWDVKHYCENFPWCTTWKSYEKWCRRHPNIDDITLEHRLLKSPSFAVKFADEDKAMAINREIEQKAKEMAEMEEDEDEEQEEAEQSAEEEQD